MAESSTPAGRPIWTRPPWGTSKPEQEISVLPGRTYYFRLDMNEKGRWISSSGAVAGLTGMLVSSAISAGADERGLFDFTPLDEAAAQAAMYELRLAQ